jgi:hypothetical protein
MIRIANENAFGGMNTVVVKVCVVEDEDSQVRGLRCLLPG